MTLTRVTTVLFIVINFAALACSLSHTPALEVMGLHIGMDKADAKARLNEISEFIRNEGRNQEIWNLKDPSRFTAVAVGYREDKIRYVTAFVDKNQATEHIAFSSVGDLQKAKAEIMEPHYRYIWDFAPSGDEQACSVIAYGDNPDFLTMYTLVEKAGSSESSKTGTEEEDDD